LAQQSSRLALAANRSDSVKVALPAFAPIAAADANGLFNAHSREQAVQR
jgi:hypothetical protein